MRSITDIKQAQALQALLKDFILIQGGGHQADVTVSTAVHRAGALYDIRDSWIGDSELIIPDDARRSPYIAVNMRFDDSCRTGSISIQVDADSGLTVGTYD